MPQRWADWWRQSEADLRHARHALDEASNPAVKDADERSPDLLLDKARALDKLYIATRYPNGLPSGAPADYYTQAEAERAIADPEAILARCRGMLPK